MNRTADQDNANNNRSARTVNVMDILRYLIFRWKWFLLSIVVFGGFYYYQYSKAPFVYAQSEMVMIKTPMNTVSTARITRTNMSYNSVSVAGEILQLRSKELMRQTIARLNTDVSYTIKDGLRYNELYTRSPIQVKVLDVERDGHFQFIVSPVDAESVLIKEKGDKNDTLREWKVGLDKITSLPLGEVLVTKTSQYTEEYYDQEITVRKVPIESMVSYFISNLNVVQMKDDASLLQVYMEDRSPERAAEMISTLIEVYNQVSRDDKNQIGISTAEFINERLAIIESELGAVESDIEQIRTSNQGMDVSTAGQFYVSDTRQYEGERNKVETDIKLAEMMREYLTSKTKQNELIPNNTGLVDGSVENQIVDYNATLLRRNRLVESGSTSNPIVQDLDRTLDAMRSNINRAVDNTVEGLQIKIDNIRQSEREARGRALSIPQKQRVMLSVERQQKVKEELYLYLLNKREENALNKAITEDNIRVIDPASGSKRPIAPIKVRKMAMGLGLGVVVPAALFLLMMMVDTGVRSRQDIEAVVSVPFLGEIPLAKRGQKEERGIMVAQTGRDPVSEAFRILRTNISFMSSGGVPPKVITFTSFTSGVGKTFNVLNLAVTLSYLGKKVVVVDLDLRKGTLSDRKGITGKGVCHYLIDKNVSLDDIIVKSTDSDHLDFIPIGMIAPNPVELLLEDRLDTLIEELKEEYDYVLIDGVPTGIVADASIVDRISDLTLFVIRAGKMDRRQLPEVERLYTDYKLTNMALILNGYKAMKGGYGYGYGTYSYGYGIEKKKWWKS